MAVWWKQRWWQRPKQGHHRHLLKSLGQRLLPGGVAATLVLILHSLGGWNPLEQLTYVALFRLRGTIPWSDRIVVIEVDDATLKALGRFPLARQHYATLLEKLTPAEPAVVVLDILFAEATPDDARLARAMQAQGRVVLAQSWDVSGQPLPPVPLLKSAAIALGHVDQRTNADGLVRFIEAEKGGIPALGIVTAQVYSLVYDDVPLPRDRPLLWLNWPGSHRGLSRYSLIEVLRGNVPVQQLRDKVVLVGVTAAALDSLQTPYDRNPPTSGVYLQATAIHNLLEQTFLHPMPESGLLPLVLLFSLGFSGLMTIRGRLGYQLFLWVTACLFWGVVSLLAFHQGCWLPVVSPLAALTLTFATAGLIAQHQTTTLLRESEERYALAASGSNEGLWDWNLTREIIYLSPRWRAMLGDIVPSKDLDTAPLQESSPQEWFNRVHPEDLPSLQATIHHHLDGYTPHVEHEYRIKHQDGSYRWMLCRGLVVRHGDGQPYRLVGSQTDITVRKEAEAKLRHHAFYDELTGLPNRALLIEKLRDAIAIVQQFPNTSFAVLWLDLDRFKVVNNSLGNEMGDRLLVAAAQRLRSFLAEEDVVARMGGDEFAILLTQIHSIGDATYTADRIQQLLSLPFYLDGNEVFTTVSTGIVLSSLLYTQPEHLLRDADTAMHRAKSLGRARYQVFDTAMRTRMVERMQLENDLRRAVSTGYGSGDRHELFLQYQPIIQLSSSETVGFEALVRWQHPTHGVVPPARFIPMAEETGLIIDVGWWILKQACQQMRQWRVRFGSAADILTINVNLSTKQFSQSGLAEHVRQILSDTGLDPCFLKLEITESTVMENASAVVGMLHQLRTLGVQLAIDDFGTGYSSLSYLPRFPTNTLKIDRSFVSKMNRRSDEREIIRTILLLAHNLGMDVVAEGVETADQANQLLRLGCEYGQGYYFSKPLASEAATELLERHLL